MTTWLINVRRKDEGLAIAEERIQPNEEAHLDSIIETFTATFPVEWDREFAVEVPTANGLTFSARLAQALSEDNEGRLSRCLWPTVARQGKGVNVEFRRDSCGINLGCSPSASA